MKVRTDSERALRSQKLVLELLHHGRIVVRLQALTVRLELVLCQGQPLLA